MVSSSPPPATQQQNVPLPAAPLPGLRPSTSQHLHQPPLALATTSTSSSCTAPPTLQLSDFPTSRQVGKRTPGAHRPFLTYPASKPHPHALTNSRTPPPAVARPRRHSLYPPPSYPPPCIRCSHVLLPRGKRKPSAVHTTTRPPRCIVHTSSHPRARTQQQNTTTRRSAAKRPTPCNIPPPARSHPFSVLPRGKPPNPAYLLASATHPADPRIAAKPPTPVTPFPGLRPPTPYHLRQPPLALARLTPG